MLKQGFASALRPDVGKTSSRHWNQNGLEVRPASPFMDGQPTMGTAKLANQAYLLNHL